MTEGPVYVSPFLGAGADYLALLGGIRSGGSLVLDPLVSWMGGKRDEAADILAILGLRPGHPIPAILGDASWWGWVWPTVLDAEAGPEVSAMLRFWRERGDDPRALWFWLRGVGPMPSRPEAAAQLLWLQARAASGVPVWWEDTEVVSMDGHGRGPYRAWQTVGSLKVDEAGQRQATEPKLLASDGRGDPRESGQRTVRNERLIATTRGGQDPGAPFEAGHKGTDIRGGGGIIDPGTIAARADAIRARLTCSHRVTGAAQLGGLGNPATLADRADRIRSAQIGDTLILHTDARSLTDEWAPRLGARARVCLDGPYDGKTGYPATCSRDEYLGIGEIWARHKAPTLVCEAVPLDKDLGSGWTSVQLRGGKHPEWVTCWGCDVRAIVPPLLAAMGA